MQRKTQSEMGDFEAPDFDTKVAESASRRRKLETGSMAADSTGATAQGAMPSTVGTGEFTQPLLMAMAQAITETARDVQDMKTVIVQSYEDPVLWSYAANAKRCTQTYGEQARQVKGTGVNLGPAKNYAAAGLLQAMLADSQVVKDDKVQMMEILRPRMMVAEGGTEKLSLRKAKALEDLITYCQVNVGKKNAYINVAYGETEEAQKVQEMLTKALLTDGKRSYDTAPMRPVHRELRDALMSAKGKGKGKSKAQWP